MDTMQVFSERINALVDDSGMTAKEIGAESGVSESSLSNYRKNNRECGIKNLVRLAQAFAVSADFLVGLSDSINDANDPKMSAVGLTTVARNTLINIYNVSRDSSTSSDVDKITEIGALNAILEDKRFVELIEKCMSYQKTSIKFATLRAVDAILPYYEGDERLPDDTLMDIVQGVLANEEPDANALRESREQCKKELDAVCNLFAAIVRDWGMALDKETYDSNYYGLMGEIESKILTAEKNLTAD